MSDTAPQPLVFFFGQGRADGTAAMKDVLGGKGAGLAEMTNLGIPVPPGFTIAASLCPTYLETRSFPPRLRPQLEAALGRLEAATGRQFGGGADPLSEWQRPPQGPSPAVRMTWGVRTVE